MNRFACCLVSAGALCAAGHSPAAAAALPGITAITTVQQTDGSYTVTVTGRNFGAAPSGIPCTACAPQQVELNAGGIFPVTINVASWANRQIVLNGVSLAADTAFSITVWSEAASNAVARPSIASPATVRPVITHIIASGSGANLTITIHGSGFGPAPAGIIGSSTNSSYFSFIDYNVQAPNSGTSGGGYPWNAGYNGDGVTATIASWTNTKIVMSGLGSEYGSNDWSWNPGDAACVSVWPSTAPAGAAGSAIHCTHLP